MKSPALWGNKARLADLFGPKVTVAAESQIFVFRYKSPEHWVEIFRNYYGPVVKAFAAIDPQARAALEADLHDLLDKFNVADDGTLVIPSGYLEAVITKKELICGSIGRGALAGILRIYRSRSPHIATELRDNESEPMDLPGHRPPPRRSHRPPISFADVQPSFAREGCGTPSALKSACAGVLMIVVFAVTVAVGAASVQALTRHAAVTQPYPAPVR